MKKFATLIVIGCLLATSCSNSQESTAVFGDARTEVFSPLATDGESVWATFRSTSQRDGPVELVKIDAITADVDWQQEFGIGSAGFSIFDDGVVWGRADSPLPPADSAEDQEIVLQIEAETGDIINQRPVPETRFGLPLIVTGETVWLYHTTYEGTEILIYDIETFDVIGSSQFIDWFTPTGGFGVATDMVLLDDTVWMLDGSNLVGLDTTTYEKIDAFDTDDGGLDIMEVHDGLLWVAERDKPDEGTFSYNPETKEITPSTLYESPIGNNYHGGYTYDMTDENTVTQINTETGEQVATFTDLQPSTVTVTDGYLWAHDGNQIFRYETKP